MSVFNAESEENLCRHSHSLTENFFLRWRRCHKVSLYSAIDNIVRIVESCKFFKHGGNGATSCVHGSRCLAEAS